MLRTAPRLIAAVALASFATLGVAATKTTTFNVTATVAANCFIDSAGNVAFGAYTPGTGDVDQQADIAVRCTNGTPYGLGLSVGTGGGSMAMREMGSATVASKLQYNLYTTTGRTQAWENPANAATVTNNQGGTGAGLATTNTHTVYGRLLDNAANQAALPAGDYTSTITVTINY